MEHSDFSKIVVASTFALSLTTLSLALPTSAQTGGAGSGGTTSGTTSYQGTQSARGNRPSSWGWLGLVGLANLFRKPQEPSVYR